MGKDKKVPLNLIILLSVAAALLIVLVVERSLLKTDSNQTNQTESPIVSLSPSPNKKVVYLDKSSEWELLFGEIPSQSILAKELVRQAFLLSAREEAGLLTRDAWLGDAMPNNVADELFNITTNTNQPNILTIEVGSDSDRKKVAVMEIGTDRILGYKALMQTTEELSRGKFLTAIKSSGYILAAKKTQSQEKVPPEIDNLLGQMNFLSQYSAVRQLHELIRTHGESPFLVGALVRGYANLGLLTDHNWHPAFKVFFARSLLYSQRMVAQEKHPRWAMWHRAYAFALSGQEKWALIDLDNAQKDAQSSSTDNVAGDYTKPAWVDIINAFCRYDTKSLNPDGEQVENAELLGLLQTVANEHAMNGDLAITKALEMLDKSPECYRLYNVVCRFGGVIVGHSATTDCFQVFRDKSYQRLATMPGMPEDVAKIIRKRTSSDGLLAKLFGPRGNNPAGEYNVRRELIAALFAVGKATTVNQTDTKQKAAVADNGEPSWAALGLLIREMSFVQVFRRIIFEAHMLCVAPDDTLKELKPLYADHPYGVYLDIYSWDMNVKKKAVEKAQSMQMEGAILQSFPILEELLRVAYESAKYPVKDAVDRMDFTEDDLIRSLNGRIRVRMTNAEFNKNLAHNMYMISPYSPYARSLLIDYASEDEINKVIQDSKELAASHPELMRTIARRYLNDYHFDDVERCLKTAISVSPDKDSFRMLADMYKSKGDKKKYIETLEEFLKHPDYALSHGKINEEIAYYYMAERKWHKALPYAEQAADTYSGWGLLCLANCCEALREWDKAEELHKAIADRYSRNSALSWYLFCKRTGKGDLESARKLAQEHSDEFEYIDEIDLSTYYLLEKQPQKAIDTLEKRFNKYTEPGVGILEALTAEQLKNSVKRDAALQLVIDKYNHFSKEAQANCINKDMIVLAKLIIDDLAKQQSKLDVETAQKLRLNPNIADHLYFDYLLGKYLALRGREKESLDLMKQCFTYWYYMGHDLRTLAGAELREHGMSQEAIEAILPTENKEEEKEEKKE